VCLLTFKEDTHVLRFLLQSGLTASYTHSYDRVLVRFRGMARAELLNCNIYEYLCILTLPIQSYMPFHAQQAVNPSNY